MQLLLNVNPRTILSSCIILYMGFRVASPMAKECPTPSITHTCMYTSANYTSQPHCYYPPGTVLPPHLKFFLEGARWGFNCLYCIYSCWFQINDQNLTFLFMFFLIAIYRFVHLYGFSPMCILIWQLRYLYHFSPMHIPMWQSA